MTRGEGYVDTVIAIFILLMLLVFCINVFSFLSLKQDMDHFSKELMQTATTDGRVSSNITTRQQQLVAEIGINPTLTWNAVYFNAAQRTVQYGEKIELTLTLHTRFKGFGLFSIPVTLTTKHSGMSQRYHK